VQISAKLIKATAIAVATVIALLLGTSQASASPDSRPAEAAHGTSTNTLTSSYTIDSQEPADDSHADAVYGPYRAYWICVAVGAAGVAAGSWSYFDCRQDTYGDYWLFTI
jgi:hypothetical protein